MKKIRNLCIAIIALFGLSFSANAQDTGIAPQIGSTHDYYVNSADAGVTHDLPHVGSKYAWHITKGDLATPALATEVVLEQFGGDSYTAKTEMLNLHRIDLTWKAPSTGITFYLHLKEIGSDGCSNLKIMEINPISNFNLAINNVLLAAAGTELADDYNVCAPDASAALDAGNIVYSYNTTELFYKVEVTNTDEANFDFGYNIAIGADFAGQVTAQYGTVTGTVFTSLGDLTVAGGTQTVTNTAKNSTIYIRVMLENEAADGTAFEGLDFHNVDVTLVSGTQGTAPAAAIATIGTDHLSADDNNSNQIVKARPTIDGINAN